MLETRRLEASIKLDTDDFRATFKALQDQGWTRAILQSEREFLRLAGIAENHPLRNPPLFYTPHLNEQSISVAGDIFFQENDLYYCICAPRNFGRRYSMDRFGRRLIYGSEESEPPKLEIGIMSSKADDIDEKIRAFSTAFEHAVTAAVDGRKTRHMIFDWATPKVGQSRLRDIQKIGGEEVEVRFETARLTPELVAGSEVLTSNLSRDILQELSQARFARERDIFAQRSRRQDEVRITLEELKKTGLVTIEYLLECKKHGSPLTRLADPAQLKSTEVATLRCPSCGCRFDEEILAEGYSVSELGRTLIQHSHWMTIWITHKLSELSVPSESVLWNLSEFGDEVDIVVEFLGQLWIFELKDREFGAGDAHPFNYRRVRYHAQKAIIVTTDKVARDAKRVFEELAKETRGPRQPRPIFIEGLDKTVDALRQEVSAAASRYACRCLETLGAITGYDLPGIVATRFGGSFQTEPDSDELDM